MITGIVRTRPLKVYYCEKHRYNCVNKIIQKNKIPDFIFRTLILLHVQIKPVILSLPSKDNYAQDLWPVRRHLLLNKKILLKLVYYYKQIKYIFSKDYEIYIQWKVKYLTWITINYLILQYLTFLNPIKKKHNYYQVFIVEILFLKSAIQFQYSVLHIIFIIQKQLIIFLIL